MIGDGVGLGEQIFGEMRQGERKGGDGRRYLIK